MKHADYIGLGVSSSSVLDAGWVDCGGTRRQPPQYHIQPHSVGVGGGVGFFLTLSNWRQIQRRLSLSTWVLRPRYSVHSDSSAVIKIQIGLTKQFYKVRKYSEGFPAVVIRGTSVPSVPLQGHAIWPYHYLLTVGLAAQWRIHGKGAE